MMLDSLDTRILIVGLGLLGGSYAAALSARGYTVTAITLSDEDIEYARSHGMIVTGASWPDPALIAEADLIVLALYPHLVAEWLRDNQAYVRPHALITDVTGVKGCVVPEVQALLREDLEFIAAHPMAGREVSGVRNSDPAIFRGANYIVTPTARNTSEAIAVCRRLGELLGFAHVSELSIEDHDRMIAFLSQLTHCIAIALMTCQTEGHLEEYTGDSFRDLTRIARLNDEMWSELFLANREPLLAEMELFERELERLRGLLLAEDREGLRQMMRASTARRALFDKKE